MDNIATSDYFNLVIGHIEDIVVDDAFQRLQHDFMEAHHARFDATTDENRIEYSDIFAVYTATMETHIVHALQARMDADGGGHAFDMDRFAAELSTCKGRLDGEIFELLFSLSDFVTFKEMVMDYKAFKAGAYADIGAGIVVQRLHNSDEDV